jgi:hypothetical protein
MIRLIATALACAALLLSSACSTPPAAHYRQARPVFDPTFYFAGHTRGWGMFQQRSGEVVKRFTVDLQGHGDAQRFTLDESFTYDDGSRQQRQWVLRKAADGSWRGTAGDVIGDAIGEQAGNALHWQYVLSLPVDGETYAMDMDDWMFLIDGQTLLNRTTMRKFGVMVGEVTLAFRKD